LSPERNRPTLASGAIEAIAGGPFAYFKGKAEIDLTEISGDTTNPRYEVYLAGWTTGYESREAEIARLRWERDLWYFCANNKGKRPSDFYRHQTNAMWEVQA